MSGRVTFDCLQRLVETEAWKRDPRLLTWILNEYSTLVIEQPEEAQNFGTAEFWAVVLGEEDESTIQTGESAFQAFAFPAFFVFPLFA